MAENDSNLNDFSEVTCVEADNFIKCLQLLAISLAAAIAGYVLMPLLADCIDMIFPPVGGFLRAAGPLVCLALTLGMVRLISGNWHDSAKMLDMSVFPVKALIWVLPAAIGLTILCCGVTFLWGELLDHCNIPYDKPLTTEIMLDGNTCQVIMLLAIALLAAPFFEEIIMRRALYGVLKNYIGNAGAIAITSVLFALSHFSLLQIPGLIIMAVIWHVAYLKSKTLWTSMLLHLCNNIVAALLMIAARWVDFLN